MMGFTFLVGIAFAYVLKAMTFLFSGLSEKGLSEVLKKSRIWGRAYRMYNPQNEMLVFYKNDNFK